MFSGCPVRSLFVWTDIVIVATISHERLEHSGIRSNLCVRGPILCRKALGKKFMLCHPLYTMGPHKLLQRWAGGSLVGFTQYY